MPARRVLLALCIALSALPLIPTGAGATGSDSLWVHRLADPQASSTSWTLQRMRAAKPLPLLPVAPADVASLAADVGEPYSIPGTEPESYSSSATSSGARRRPIPFQRIEIETPSDPPYAAHGKIFGSSDSGDFSCSGTAVTSDNKSVVWTAGHCLYLDGAASFDLVFVPGYEEEDPTPFGVWAADLVMTPKEWQSAEDPRFDFGAFRVTTNAEGQLLGDVIATRGIAFNQQPTEQLQSFGYPSLPSTKFDGEHLQSCSSRGSGRILDEVVAMGCDMQEGSSGGGWVMRGQFVISNQSFGNMRVWPNIGFGPYLGDTARALYDSIRGGTSPMPTPTPTAAPGDPKLHPMKVTFKMDHVRVSGKRRLSVSGRLTATDGYTACAKTAPLSVYRWDADTRTFYPVGRLLFTASDGRYQTRLRDREGLYGVYAPTSPYDLTNDCTDAESRILRHRH